MKKVNLEILQDKKFVWNVAFAMVCILMAGFGVILYFLSASPWVSISFFILLFLFLLIIGGMKYSFKRLEDYKMKLRAGIPRYESDIKKNVVYRFLGKCCFDALGSFVYAALAPIQNEEDVRLFFVRSWDVNSLHRSIIESLERDDLFMFLDPDECYTIKDNLRVVGNEMLPEGKNTLIIFNNYGGMPYMLECEEDKFFFVDEEIKLFLIRGEPSREQNKEEEDNQKEEESQS